MNSEKNQQDQALDALLATAFGVEPCKEVDFETVLAALTPEERAALSDPAKRVAFLDPNPTVHVLRQEQDADDESS